MDGIESCDVPSSVVFEDVKDTPRFQNLYSNLHANNVKTMINGNVSNVSNVKNSHRPTKAVVSVLGFVAIAMAILVVVLVTHYTVDSKSSKSSSANTETYVASLIHHTSRNCL